MEHADEVVMRRTIGLHKDEFFLQRKRTTKSEIQSLLEGAGFSKSNPYYIVQQGKVQDLCTMSDEDRLKLLQQVAGTIVYDEKKAESARKMHENQTSREKIIELLGDMDERLEELESERDELTQYSALDRERRCVEYSLYHSEWRKARDLLAVLEEDRAEHAEHVRNVHDDAKKTHEAIRNAEARAKAISHAAKRNRNHLQSLQEDNKEAVKLHTQLQVQSRDLQESFRSGQEQYKRNQKELSQVNQEIVKTERDLIDRVQPAYEEASKKLQDLTDQRDAVISEVEALYAKQGRGQQFSTKKERDAFLKKNLAELEAAIAEKQAEMKGQQETLANLRRTIDKETKDIQKIEATVAQKSGHFQEFSKTMEDKKKERLQLHDTLKEEWRKAEEQRDEVRQHREAYHRAISDARKSTPRATSLGLEALNTIVEEERLVHGEQYFGMLMDNFTLRNEKYQTAVEVAAQNSLFHVIVDSDDTAGKLLTRLEKGRLGRVTFLPLNQLRPEVADKVPNTTDVRPMLEMCTQYDPKVERAMQHVFGKKLIARSQELASEWSIKLNMDAITLDGDLCSRKGALTGGYVDTNKSRLGAHYRQRKAQHDLEVAEQKYASGISNAKEMEQKTTSLLHELQTLETKHSQLSRMVESNEEERDRLLSRVGQQKKQVATIETTGIPALERNLATLKSDVSRLEAEMGTDLTKTLSDEERDRLIDLKKHQANIVKEIEKQSEVVTQAGVERQNVESFLNDNLLKRQRELSESVQEDDPSNGRRKSRLSSAAFQEQRKQELEDCLRQLEVQARVKDDIESRVETARTEEEKFRGDLISAKNGLEQLQNQDNKNMKAIADANEKTERLLNKRSMCISKRETYSRKIQELGSLPPPVEIEKVSALSISELMRSLEGINKKLKKYSHVNKKAFDQYVNFNEQREALLKRKEELDRGADKVKELIDSLDMQKDEAINRTFRGVRSHFKDVFQELVPMGSGELFMRTAMDEEADGGTDEEESSMDTSKKNTKASDDIPDVSLYRGIGIKIRFSAVGENYIMSQLSGGQKALVALALIFAIQRCDPAPFYLFDELDQALDSSYRAAVADLISRQANSEESPTQFIVSTFRPELVAAANSWFAISHQNKVSSLHDTTREDSLQFIANMMNDEEAVGEVTTVAASRKSRGSLASRKRKAEEATVDAED